MTLASVGEGNAKRDPVQPSKPRLLSALGLGLITGAADDPSGIATSSQTGAQFPMPRCGPYEPGNKMKHVAVESG